jgi:hypothetical protein
MAAQMSRALGISVSNSLVKFVASVVVDVSTIGDSPVNDDADALALHAAEAREIEG